MRRDEDFAKQRFDAYLRLIQPSANLAWRDGIRNKAPDYYLIYDGQEFVVEVTTIVEKVESDSGSLSRLTIDCSRDDFLRDVEARAKAQGILTGTYYVGFPLFDSIPDFLAKRKAIRKQLLDWIEKTQSASTTPEFAINIEERDYCSILKTNDHPNSITVGVAPITAKWEEEAKLEACKLLQECIDDKTRRLARFSQQKILLLLHNYPFVSIEYYRQCLPTLNTAPFHTIFIVDGNCDYVLCTLQSNWSSR